MCVDYLNRCININCTYRPLYILHNTQNDYIYGELGRTPLIVTQYFIIIKYWLKVMSSYVKYMSHAYNMMLEDMVLSNNRNWSMSGEIDFVNLADILLTHLNINCRLLDYKKILTTIIQQTCSNV
jgi:hypothetical protein